MTTGKGLARLNERLSQWLREPVTIAKPEDVPAAIQKVKERFDDLQAKHGLLVLNREVTQPMVVHQPELVDKVEEVYKALLAYPWERFAPLKSDLRQASANPVVCDTGYASLGSSLYEMPKPRFLAQPR